VKPPGWLVIEPKSKWTLSEDGRSVNMHIRVRLWHPGFWLALLRHWWKER
jgi:hypothetical protein